MAGVKGRSGPKQEKPWRDAIMLAVNEAQGDRKKLRALAEKLVDEAMAGSVVALKEIGDRLDGKPAQALTDGDGEPLAGPVITVYVPSNNRD